MLKKVSPQWILGLIIGIVMPVFGIALMMQAHPDLVGIQRFDAEIVKQVNVQVITLGMIINAGLFFVFLKLHKEDVGQGILFVSVIYLILIFIYRFLL